MMNQNMAHHGTLDKRKYKVLENMLHNVYQSYYDEFIKGNYLGTYFEEVLFLARRIVL